MVKVKENLVGQTFGRLTVIAQAEDYIVPKTGRHYPQWLCECSCPEHNQVVVLGNRLKMRNGTKSCGCISKEIAGARFQEHAAEYNRANKHKTNPVKLDGEYGVGWTLNTNAKFYFDLEDYDKIKEYCWCEHILQNGYHALETHDNITGDTIRMHWLIVGKWYDHEDRNPLNNMKSNLRPATQSENVRNSSISKNNTSGYIGVSWNKRNRRWYALIRTNGKQRHLGSYKEKVDAIKARLRAELKYYGVNFAPQRHLFKEYNITEED